MLTWILLALLLVLVQALIPGYYKGQVNQREALIGPQDDIVMPVAGKRAQRAMSNLQETLPIFLALAILAIVLPAPGWLGTAGAAIYVIARAAYVPAYIAGTKYLRSAAWTVSMVGILMLAFEVASHAFG